MNRRNRTLHGAVVVITGGARGIGLATAVAFQQAGADVAIGDLDGELAEKVAANLGFTGFGVDVSSIDSFESFLDQVEGRLGPIGVLVNNAGIMPIGPLHLEPESVTQKIVAVNLVGAIHGTKLAMARMLPREQGHIVNVASAVGRFAAPNSATYSATKFGVVGLTQAVRGELRGTKLEASVILPAATNTDLVSGLTDTGPVAQPEDVAAAIVDVVLRPRFETWVPRSNQRSFKVMQLLPYRVLETLAHKAPATSIFLSQDSAARAAYESRARE